MTEHHRGAETRTSRVIKARPEQLYAAFLDPTALVDWLPPGEMTGAIHEFNARVGGGYRMSLFYPPDGRTFRGRRVKIGGTFADLTRVAMQGQAKGLKCEFAPGSFINRRFVAPGVDRALIVGGLAEVAAHTKRGETPCSEGHR